MDMEFSVQVMCPHCEAEELTTVEFNEMSLGPDGGVSDVFSENCIHCGEEFWFNARLSMEVEQLDGFKKKPKK
jgi:hypothetical protein